MDKDFAALFAEAVAAKLASDEAERRYQEAIRHFHSAADCSGVRLPFSLLYESIDRARAAREQPSERAGES